MPKHRPGRTKKVADMQPSQEDFFEIDVERASVHWSLHVFAGVVCVIFALWVWMLNPLPHIHGDRLNLATLVLMKAHPDNFVSDPFYSSEAVSFYPAVPQWIMGALISKFGVVGGHRAIQFPLCIAYLLVMYGVLYYLTRSAPAALLVALASVIWRDSLGGTYWGLDRMEAVQPRSFTLVLMPVLFILFWKLRKSWWLLIPFFVAGLLFNLNPPSSFYFIVLSWFSLFLVGLYNRDKILYLIGGGVASVLGALPYIYRITNQMSKDVELTEVQTQEYMKALQFFYTKMSFFPLPASTLAKAFMLGFSLPLLLAIIGWCLRKEKRNMFDNWLTCFFILAFVGTVIAQVIQQLICSHFKIMPFLPNCMRGQKYVYLVLYIYTAWLLAKLFGQVALRERCILITVIAVIVAMMPPFKNNSRNPWGQWRHNSMQMSTLLRGEKIEIAGWHNSMANICAWARQKTPKDSLFLFAHREGDAFRAYALRSIVSSRRAGDMALFSGPKAMILWAKYYPELEWITSSKDVSRLLKLAERSGADYIIVPNSFPEVTGWTAVMRDHFWTGYKKP